MCISQSFGQYLIILINVAFYFLFLFFSVWNIVKVFKLKLLRWHWLIKSHRVFLISSCTITRLEKFWGTACLCSGIPDPAWGVVGWLGERNSEAFLRDPSIFQLSLLLFWLIFFPSQETLNLVSRMENLCPLTNHISFQIHFLTFCVLSYTLSLKRACWNQKAPRFTSAFRCIIPPLRQ